MKTQLVLIEKEDKIRNAVFGCSGLMLNNKYVITTANILLDNDQKQLFKEMTPGKLYPESFSSHNAPLNVVWMENGLYVVKRTSVLFSAYISTNIQKSSKYIFKNWAIDSIDNNRDLNDSLSLFFILTFEGLQNTDDFINTLSEWWYLLGSFDINKGDNIYTKSAPFGNRHFLNSYSKGIVSNVCGNNSCFILSDCPSSPGSEGSPVYLSNGSQPNVEIPMGLILASLSWWKGEWIGLTLLVDIRPIILELVDIPIKLYNIKNIEDSKIISTTEFSLVQVYCGSNRGTAILLNEEKGIFITNSHVLEDVQKDANILCVLRNKSWHAKLIYRTPYNDVFDLAVFKCNVNLIKELNLKSIHISKKKCKLGDYVYSAGFSLLPKECQPSPILSYGCISQSNPFMLKTTCTVHPGASGGAILDDEAALLGIIVCNLRHYDTVHSRVNMAIPFSAVENVISIYLDSGDTSVLNKLHMKNKEAEIIWKRLEGKL